MEIVHMHLRRSKIMIGRLTDVWVVIAWRQGKLIGKNAGNPRVVADN
jgi:hypothetical protein